MIIFLSGAPKRRKDREREKIYEPEDVDGGFSEFTLKSARRYPTKLLKLTCFVDNYIAD